MHTEVQHNQTQITQPVSANVKFFFKRLKMHIGLHSYDETRKYIIKRKENAVRPIKETDIGNIHATDVYDITTK